MFKKIILAVCMMQLVNSVQAEEQLLDEIVAVVDDTIIVRSELNRAMNSITKQIEAQGNQLPPKDVLESQVLERLIVQEVQIARAEQVGIQISEEEIDAALSNIAQQNGVSLEQMIAAVENDGFDFSDFRRDMKRDLQTERVRYAYANSKVKVSDHEIKLFLADNALDQGEVSLQHILIAVPQGGSVSDAEASKKKSDEVYEKLIAGENFAVLATQVSDGQRALEGGRLGWRPINQLPPLFTDQIKSMEVGDISRPIRSPNGYHIIKLDEKRSNTVKKVELHNALHFMVETNQVVTQREGMNIINNVHEKLMAGEDFAELAESESDDHNSAPLGGDLGWFELNQYGQRMGDVIKSLNEGDISKPFQTENGWHIVKYMGKKESDITEAFKKQQAENAIKERKMQEAIEYWIREIRGEAFVDIRL
ncbi:peptidylprolyl isomerase [Marinicella rhabdoformis]|uniref:peptidylprolyl isomerase n=1 Tax=Marinicella rhabdoformis TaxID=2580566 RepID=UPI0012AECCF2|nr:peptidylprolyl isomerase [Marinicella rhabdoformis]